MNRPLVLLWAFMFAWQTNHFSTKIENTNALVQDTQLGLHEVEVAHNLTRDALSSTKDALGACAFQVSHLEAKLQISESDHLVKDSTILALEELVRVLRLDSAQKSNDLLEFKAQFDRIWWWFVWVALPITSLIFLLSVKFFFFLKFIHFCRFL